jgi:hypothetical protein
MFLNTYVCNKKHFFENFLFKMLFLGFESEVVNNLWM